MLIMGMVAFSYGERNLAIFAAAISGALVGFLWYNCYPASIFMGDAGSMLLGFVLACISVQSVMKGTAAIALVGCYHGYQVTGSAESVGRLTTQSVVKSIFMVIVIDAVFAIFFSAIGM